ncbi:hypothetical protein HPB48_000458 [Haemaphysalis longicornis]|uniref:Uncharacterized protein n=1 Tax=Haemaphysalis longicornis TaxID=44386 RepID=A0A9J6GKG5_HAELO|nr:hypothetical protein HPB48_000458 [Haemaphysalis longicornis]
MYLRIAPCALHRRRRRGRRDRHREEPAVSCLSSPLSLLFETSSTTPVCFAQCSSHLTSPPRLRDHLWCSVLHPSISCNPGVVLRRRARGPCSEAFLLFSLPLPLSGLEQQRHTLVRPGCSSTSQVPSQRSAETRREQLFWRGLREGALQGEFACGECPGVLRRVGPDNGGGGGGTGETPPSGPKRPSSLDGGPSRVLL